MNQSLIQINDNLGVVSDEKGKLRLVSKKDKSYNFEDILLAENHCEDLYSKLIDKKAEQKHIKYNIGMGKITGSAAICFEIMIFIIAQTFSISSGIAIPIIIVTFISWLIGHNVLYGSFTGNYIKNLKIKNNINEMEADLEILEKKLFFIKQDCQFEVNDSFKDNSNSDAYANIPLETKFYS